MTLEVAALVVTTVALVVSTVAILRQVRQGRQFATAVFSTVDQIYRRITGPDPDEPDRGQDTFLHAQCSPKYIKRNKEARLHIDGYLTDWQQDELLEVKCVVERPSEIEDPLLRNVTFTDHTIDLHVAYPTDFEGSTSDPGRYNVYWRVTARLEWIEGGKEQQEASVLASCEGSFFVMP